MTRHDDTGRGPVPELDRLLGEWLGEGARMAPEAPIAAAVEFARMHPRRRDPFGALRRDPMPGRVATFAPGLRLVVSLVLLGLLLAATLAVVGPGRRPAVVPVPTPSPTVASPVPSITPTASPSVSASPSPSASRGPFVVTLDTGTPTTDTVTVVDRSGRITAVTDVTQSAASNATDPPVVVRSGPTTLDLGWIDAVCDADYTITLDETASILVLTKPACVGDTLALARVVRLTFDGSIDSTGVEVTVDGPGARG